jgi:DNA-binding CsgD family transcriptional regulator
MSDTLLVSTRKGLFTVARGAGQWEIAGVDFLGDNVTLTLIDRRDGRRYAALDHGHFGVKLHRSTTTGWEGIAAPAYPPKPDGYEENDIWGRPLAWSTARIWALEAGGLDEPGVIWCGTLPGGLFRSADYGESWEMIRSLWDHPQRKKWARGNADHRRKARRLSDEDAAQSIRLALAIAEGALADRLAAALAGVPGLRLVAAGDAADVIIMAATSAAQPANEELAPASRDAAARSPPIDVSLTPRELEVLVQLAEGASNKTIARRLAISVHTAKFHVASVIDKLDAIGRTDAVAHAARLGIIHL